MRILGAALLLMVSWLPASASAGQKVAVFPFDMILQKSEEDFFIGAQGPTPEELRRLELARDELIKLLSADSRFQPVDLSGLKDEIKAAAPLSECNGCEIDLAGKVAADVAMTSVIDKISETHLSLNVAVIDVAKSKLVRNASVLIQGNTDEAWLHGVKWIVKNRLLAEDATR
jgi:riboflavin synthase